MDFYRREVFFYTLFVFCRFLAICCCRLACTISARSSPTAPPRQRRYRGPDGPAHTLRPQIAMSTQDAGPGSPYASEDGKNGEFTLIGRGGRPAANSATGEAPQVPTQGEGGGTAPSFAAVAARAAATTPRPNAILLFHFLNMVVDFYRRGILIDFVFCRFFAICCCRLACTVSARSSPTRPSHPVDLVVSMMGLHMRVFRYMYRPFGVLAFVCVCRDVKAYFYSIS